MSSQGGSLKSRQPIYVPVLLLFCMSLMGCDVVKGIFKAGVWIGVLGVFVFLGLIVFGVSKLRS